MNSSLEKTLDSDPILELKILIFLPLFSAVGPRSPTFFFFSYPGHWRQKNRIRILKHATPIGSAPQLVYVT